MFRIQIENIIKQIDGTVGFKKIQKVIYLLPNKMVVLLGLTD